MPERAEADPRADAGDPRYRRALVALFCAAIATFAQVYAPQGLLPEIASGFGRSESASSLAIGATTIGLAAGMLPWVRLGDRIGRVAAMRWAVVAVVAVGCIAPFAPGFEVFVAARFAEGVAAAGLPAIAVTALAETVRPAVLGGAVGAFVAGNTFGGLLGRIVGAVAGEAFGWQNGMLIVACLAGCAGAAFLLLVPPTVVAPVREWPVGRSLLANLRNPGAMVMVAQGFLLMGGFVAVFNYLAFRLQRPPFDLGLAQVSALFLVYIAGSVSSGTVWRLARRLPPAGRGAALLHRAHDRGRRDDAADVVARGGRRSRGVHRGILGRARHRARSRRVEGRR